MCVYRASRQSRRPLRCHCEPVRTLVWQSVFLKESTDSHASDIGHWLGMTGDNAGGAEPLPYAPSVDGIAAPLAPSDEGAVTEGDWGRDLCSTMLLAFIVSPSVGALRKHAGGMFLASDLGGYAAVAATSLVRGRQKTVPMDRDGFHDV